MSEQILDTTEIDRRLSTASTHRRSLAGRPRASRWGANAVEFALLLPVLVAMLGGMVDYGWYFWREALVTNALREGVRAGSLQKPTSSETGGACSACTTSANSVAGAALTTAGITTGVPTLAATMVRMPSTGTPCTYGVVLQPTITHTRIWPIVPGPTTINVRVMSLAQNVSCP